MSLLLTTLAFFGPAVLGGSAAGLSISWARARDRVGLSWALAATIPVWMSYPIVFLSAVWCTDDESRDVLVTRVYFALVVIGLVSLGVVWDVVRGSGRSRGPASGAVIVVVVAWTLIFIGLVAAGLTRVNSVQYCG